MISFACPACGRRLKVNDEAAGKKSKCPQCGQAVRVPEASQPSAVGVPASPTADARTVPPPADRQTRGAADPETKPPSAASLPGGGPAGGPPPEQYDFLAPPQAADELGRLGPYRVLQVLGAGGMGVVFRAEDPMLQRPVALKAMLPTLAVSESSKKRFLREARAAAAIDHDHIVHIYQVGEDRGVPFLAMQFLKGEPLDERLKREPRLPVAEAARIGGEVALGLGAAHSQGLIHRDIKPANVWLEGEAGRVKILDFGLARAASQEAGLTQTGAIVGTPAYMAPEQANSQPVDARTDLFSLGCVVYQMTTGERPFKGTDTLSTLMAVAMDQPKPPDQVRPEVPAALSELVMRLLSKDPGGRPGSASGVAEELRNAGAGVGAGVGRPRKGKAAAAGVQEAPEAATRSLPGRRKKRASKDLRSVGNRVAVAVAAGVVGVSTLAVLLAVWFLSPPAHRPQAGPASPAGPGAAVNSPFPNAGGAAPPGPAPDNQGGPAANAPPPNGGGVTPPPVVQGPGPSAGALSFETGWEPVDPDGDCKFTPDKTALTIEAPAKYHDLAVDGHKKNAPRFLRDVEGDFTAQVMVNSDFFPTDPSTSGRPQAQASAGLVVMNDDQTYGVLEQKATLINGNPICLTSWGWCSGKGGNFGLPPAAAPRPAPPDGKPKHFRLKRNGNGLLAAYSADGAQWLEFSEMKVPLHARLKLGVFVATWSSAPFKARFEDFRLTGGGVNPAAPADQAPPPVVKPSGDANEQVMAVADELKKLNPGFDGKVTPTIENGVVTGLSFRAFKVKDITPLQTLNGLKTLSSGGWGEFTPLSDLSPLKDLKLVKLSVPYSYVSDLSPLKDMKLTALDLGYTFVFDLSPLKGMPLTEITFTGAKVSDLSPLKGMPLTHLSCPDTPVSDLSPLTGMRLKELWINRTPVSDLSPLKGAPLTGLGCSGAKVTDLSPLKGSSLRWIECDYKPERDAAILRSIPTLESINNKPAKDVLNNGNAK